MPLFDAESTGDPPPTTNADAARGRKDFENAAAIGRLQHALAAVVAERAALRNRIEDLRTARERALASGAAPAGRLAPEVSERLLALCDALGAAPELSEALRIRAHVDVAGAICEVLDRLAAFAKAQRVEADGSSAPADDDRLRQAQTRIAQLTAALDIERARVRELEHVRASLVHDFVDHVNGTIERTRRQNAEIDSAIGRIYRSPWWTLKRLLTRK